MSAASSDAAVQQSHSRAPSALPASGSALEGLALRPDKPVIAVDLDDVLSQTNRVVAEWHNDTYGSNMTLAHFYYYYYWKNPFWGAPEETFRKVEEFYRTTRLDEAPPVEGALESLKKLIGRGFQLVVVTARQQREMERSMRWLQRHYPGIFETMICTGQSQETLADEHEALTKLSKAQVCHKLGAKFIVDDSIENAHKCARANPPVPVLLFGDNSWNQREAKFGDMKDELSFDEKLELEGGREFWRDDLATIPEGITRVKNWHAVVQWVDENIQL
ncbi:hypothetical protein BKA93DRAFT_805631 [Sparassis latifolia]